MDSQKRMIAIQRLRQSDADTLLVLTQDALRATLTRLDPGTLADLLALSEVENGLPVALSRDLRHFRDQMFREIADLPDSPVLAEFARDLGRVSPAMVPACLRDAVIRLLPERKNPEASEALQQTVDGWEGVEPKPVLIPVRAAATRRAAAATAAGTAPIIPPKERLPPATAAAKKVKTPVAQVDERRAEWIQEEVISRLDQYMPGGLKESVLIAGARHRSPWKDLSAEEILIVLRRLRRENRLRFLSGRWTTLSAR